MKVEPQHGIDPIASPGDFVQVFTGGMAVCGYVYRRENDDCTAIEMSVHQGSDSPVPDRPGGGKALAPLCLGWEVLIPMTSVLLIRRVSGMPTGCKCHELGVENS